MKMSLMPKIELHAHLSGCVSQDTLQTMAQERNRTFQKFDVKEEFMRAISSASSSENETTNIRNKDDEEKKKMNQDDEEQKMNQDKDKAKDKDERCSSKQKKEIFDKAMQRCFAYFDTVAKVVVDLESLTRATRDVLDAFANDGCVYLELRTTPKSFTTCSSPNEDEDASKNSTISSTEDYVVWSGSSSWQYWYSLVSSNKKNKKSQMD